MYIAIDNESESFSGMFGIPEERRDFLDDKFSELLKVLIENNEQGVDAVTFEKGVISMMGELSMFCINEQEIAFMFYKAGSSVTETINIMNSMEAMAQKLQNPFNEDQAKLNLN